MATFHDLEQDLFNPQRTGQLPEGDGGYVPTRNRWQDVSITCVNTNKHSQLLRCVLLGRIAVENDAPDSNFTYRMIQNL